MVFLVHQVIEVGELEAAGGPCGRRVLGADRDGDGGCGALAEGAVQRVGIGDVVGQGSPELRTPVIAEGGPRHAGHAEEAGIGGAGEAASAGIACEVEGPERPVALLDVQARAVAVAGGEEDVAVIEPLPPGDVGVVVAIRALDQGVLAIDFKTVEVAAGDEVDHPADGVGAVGRGRAVLQDLDPADSGGGDEVEVGAPALEGRRRAVRQPPAVHQGQGPGGAEAAQVDGRRARSAIVAVGLAEGGLGGGDRLDQLDDGGRALRLQVFLGEDVHRKGRVLRGAADEGAGDHHLLDRGSLRALGLGEASAHKADGDDGGGRAAKIATLHGGSSPLVSVRIS